MIMKLEDSVLHRKDGRCNFLEIRKKKLLFQMWLWLMELILTHTFNILVTKQALIL